MNGWDDDCYSTDGYRNASVRLDGPAVLPIGEPLDGYFLTWDRDGQVYFSGPPDRVWKPIEGVKAEPNDLVTLSLEMPAGPVASARATDRC